MATRLKPSRINVDNTPSVGDGAAYKTDNDFHRSLGGGDMQYEDFERVTLTGNSITIEDISNNITPSSDFTVSAGTVKPGIEYVLRVNTGNTPYTMTLGTGVTNPNGYSTELTPNKVNQFKFIATSSSQLELEGVIVNDATLTITQNGTSAGTFSANASNNTTIELTDTTYTAGTGISIIEQDYSAMRGPCPDGYHIPTSDEWTAIKTAWLDLGGGEYDGNDFGMYLKLPYAGYRAHVNAYPTLQTMMGEYRSVTVNGNNIRRLAFNEDGGIYTNGGTPRSQALPIRPFKDIPVVPDSSWTTLYSGSGDAGIFHNYTLGLISISGDGTNWITIADKNLGASIDWNYGDNLAETNCGKYYQWGNNYGFPFTGNVTTSSSTVDTTGYGPGNYYSSSTFITTSASPNDWSNPKNDNLRGGETGVLTNSITNTGVTSVNGSTGAVTVSEFDATNGGVKVFTFPAVNDDITDLVTWLTSGGDAILKDSNSYCRVTMHDGANREIHAVKEAGSSRDEWVIEYNSSKIVTSVLATERKYFAPDNAGSTDQVLTKKVGGYEWANATGGVTSVNGSTGAVTVNEVPSGGTDGQVLTQTNNGPAWQTHQRALKVTLTSNGWSNSEQTVTATGVTSTNTIIVSPVPADISDYTDAGIYCSAQATDSLTFTCSTTPSGDIEVNVVILN